MEDINTTIDIISDNLFEAFYALKELAKKENPRLYDRWKAGGFMVDGTCLSHNYPNAQQVMRILKQPLNDD